MKKEVICTIEVCDVCESDTYLLACIGCGCLVCVLCATRQLAARECICTRCMTKLKPTDAGTMTVPA